MYCSQKLLTLQTYLIIAKAIIDDLGEVLRKFDTWAKISCSIKAFVFSRPYRGLSHNQKFADFTVAKLIAITIAVIPNKLNKRVWKYVWLFDYNDDDITRN